MTRNEMFAEFSQIEDEIKARYEIKESELLFRISSLELQVASLKAENDKIWKIFVEQLAEEKMKNRMMGKENANK